MTQQVPEFQFGEDALKLRQFIYQYWCDNGHGPNLRAAHEGTGLSREQILQSYRQLDLGIICVVDHDSQNCNLLKAQPFSSFPSQVEVHIDGRFHCYAGCAMESMAISKMPPFAGKEIRLESYCACCLAAVTIATRDGEILSCSPESVLIHVSASPSDWNKTNIVSMCDSMNFVADAEHATAYEKKICRRGVLFRLDQAQRFVADTAKNRMHRYDWPPARVIPERIIAGIRALGVDVTNWDG
jgi:alkylmercury lyase-like protein